MTLRKPITAAAGGCAAMLVLSVLPAEAATKVRHDPPGDAASGYDLTRTAFHNAPRRIAVKAHVNGLKRERAYFRFVFGPVSDPVPDTIVFIAKTYLRPDGSRETSQYVYVAREGVPGAARRPCAVRARWNVELDYVRVSVPQSCIGDDAGSLGMGAMIYRPGTDISDRTRWITMQRG